MYDNLPQLLVLALGAAMAGGNALALIRPPEAKKDAGDLERAPIGRSVAYIALGLLAAGWALATLLS
ncbi:MAG: hypothetical protein HKN26_11085 [Acidimicrobiales bacterium]|nr:hypothetical protein [Acidimicrobiales bacterium]